MNYAKNKKAITLIIGVLLIIPAVGRAQFGGVVFDPTNYKNALLRYLQLQQQLVQLRQTYQQVWNNYQLALQMSRSLQNMPARYRATFSQWRSFTSNDAYGNTQGWVGAVNGIGAQAVGPSYQQATVPLLAYDQSSLGAMNAMDTRNVKSVYASLELTDGANVSALATVGNVRADARTVQQQIANLEQDSLSGDAALNSEISVLNKINASNVLTLRTLQDANNLRVGSLEQQVIQAKRQRDLDVANLNFAIQMRQQAAQNLAPFNNNLTQSIGDYRLP